MINFQNPLNKPGFSNNNDFPVDGYLPYSAILSSDSFNYCQRIHKLNLKISINTMCTKRVHVC